MNEPLRPGSRGRLLLLLGLALAASGIVGFVIQMSLQRLAVPWYMPGLAFLGACPIVLSLKEKRNAWRVLALVAIVLLGGFEVVALNAMRLPPYEGPIVVGKPFPAFSARGADGSPFTQEGLVGAQNTAMVFFRGRW